MGGSSQTQTTQSSTSPWAQAQPEVNGLLSGVSGLLPNTGLNSTEQGAINQITANGQAGNPYAPAIGSAASSMLAGGGATSQVPAVQAAYDRLGTQLAPYTAAGYSTLNTPAVQGALQQAADDVSNNVNSQFAAAGRSGSGMNVQTLARGIAQAQAPIILNQANQDTQTQLAADNTLYGAGNTTASTIAGMNQNAVTNQQNGITAANDALTANNWGPQSVLAAQEIGQSLPAQNLGLLAQIGVPLAQLGTNSNGTTTTQNNPSLLQDITSVGGMLGSGPSTAANGATSAGSGLLGLLGMI